MPATKTRAHAVDVEAHSQNGTGQGLVERLREKSRLRTEVVHVERWEMDVTIRELSTKEAREMQAQLKGFNPENPAADMKAAAVLVSVSCVDPTFSVEDMTLLLADDMSMEPVNFLVKRIQALNKLGEQGVKSAENSFPDTQRTGQQGV